MMRTAFSETQARFSYRNVTVTMQEQEAAEATEEELRRELTQHYGLVAARFCGLPPSLVDAAQQLLPSIQVKTLRCDRWEGNEVSRRVAVRRRPAAAGDLPASGASERIFESARRGSRSGGRVGVWMKTYLEMLRKKYLAKWRALNGNSFVSYKHENSLVFHAKRSC